MAKFKSGELIWTKNLTIGLLAGAVLLGGAGILAQSWKLGTLGLVAASVGVSGRLLTLRTQRWAGVNQPPPMPVRVRRGRAVIARRDLVSRAMFVMVIAGWVLTIWLRAIDGTVSDMVIPSAVLGPLAFMFLLIGFSNRVVVTPTEIRVLNAFTRSVVPRHLAGRLRGTEEGALAWTVEGAREVIIPVGINQFWIRGPWNYRPAELKAAGRIQAALQAIPEDPSTHQALVVGRRPATIAFAVAAAVSFTITAFLVLSGLLQVE